MPTLRLRIVTPEAAVFEGEAALVELPTVEGQVGVYPGHVPLVAALDAGSIRLHPPGAGAVQSWVVLGGYVEIGPGLVTVLALFASGEAERVKIDEACQRAKAALELADRLPPAAVVEDRLARLRIELLRGKRGSGTSGSIG